MSMQELAAVQIPLQSQDAPTLSSFSMKQQGIGRRDSQDNVDFEATSFGSVMTTADNGNGQRG